MTALLSYHTQLLSCKMAIGQLIGQWQNPHLSIKKYRKRGLLSYCPIILYIIVYKNFIIVYICIYKE